MGISQQRLQEILRYEPKTGKFFWLVPISQLKAGARAGSIHATGKVGRKYTQIGINKKSYKAHRLAWLYMTGEWPSLEIDHIDGDGTNNRWSNLRLATRSQNMANVNIPVKARSGYRGVTKTKAGRFEANIRINGKQKYLGRFNTPAEAHRAYCAAVKEAYGEFANV